MKPVASKKVLKKLLKDVRAYGETLDQILFIQPKKLPNHGDWTQVLNDWMACCSLEVELRQELDDYDYKTR